MKRLGALFFLAASAGLLIAQPPAVSSDYRLALPNHKGLLTWSLDGFKITENSAKPNGRELGVRASDTAGKVTFLAFLFLAPESAPLTSAKCRDGAMAAEKKGNAALKILRTIEISRPGGLPVSVTTYTSPNRDGSSTYFVRGFLATEDICGDLEFYSGKSISEGDATLQNTFRSYRLDPAYAPQFADISFYAQVLFLHHDYPAAAPLFEKALAIVPSDGGPFKSAATARRMIRDQAGMSYGISGNLTKSRGIFEKGVADDPDYPLNYYNLACADAGEKNLLAARLHLKQAFGRRANMIPGETMPVPAQDDSFLPYKNDPEFWAFLQTLK